MSLEGHSVGHHHMWRVRNTELNEVFFFMSARSFILAGIALFVPIYLLTLGYNIQDVLIYFFVLYGGAFLLTWPMMSLMSRLGIKKMLLLSAPILTTHLLLIAAVSFWKIHYVWPALIGAIEIACFWPAYHLDFIISKNNGKAARQVATIGIIIAVLTSFAPWLSSIISARYGLGSVIIVGSLILIPASLVFLMPTKKREEAELNLQQKAFRIKDIKNDLISNFGAGWDSTVGAMFWPLFIYVMLGSMQKVGLLTTLGLLVTVVVTWVVARKSDQGYRVKYIRYGDMLSAVLDVAQSFVQNISHVLLVNVAGSFSGSFKSAPYTSEYYLRASEKGPGPYVLYMEHSVQLARVVMILAMLSLSYFLSVKHLLIVSFGFAAIGAMLMTLMPKSRQDKIELRNNSIKIMPRPKSVARARS